MEMVYVLLRMRMPTISGLIASSTEKESVRIFELTRITALVLGPFAGAVGVRVDNAPVVARGSQAEPWGYVGFLEEDEVVVFWIEVIEQFLLAYSGLATVLLPNS